MKTLITLLLSAFCFYGGRAQALGGQAIIMWDASPEPEVKSYIISWGRTSRGTNESFGYEKTNTVTSVSNLLNGVALGINYFAVQAVAQLTNGSTALSKRSDEVEHEVIPGKPTRVKLSLQQAPDPAGPWTETTNLVTTLEYTAPQQYFRGLVSLESALVGRDSVEP
jgi:hypothetical protein